MRIDKYLWHVRLFKTRSLATEAVNKNQIEISGQTCKASREVKIGEILKVRKEQVFFEYRILDCPKSRIGAKLVEQYLEDITPKDTLEKLEMLKLSKTQYINKWGEGRATKKDKRLLDDLDIF